MGKGRYDVKDYKESGHSLAAMVDGMAVLQLDNSFKDQRIMSKEAHLRKAKEEFLSRFSVYKLRYRYDIQNMPHTADINLVTNIVRELLQRISKSKGMLIRIAGERYFKKIRRCQKIFRHAMERRKRQIKRFLYWWAAQEDKLRQTAEERSRQRIWLLDNLSHLTPARLAQRKKILRKRFEEETNFDIPLHCKIQVLSQSRRDAFVRFAKEWSTWRESLSTLNREYSAAKAREAYIQRELQSASGFVAHGLRTQLVDVQSVMNSCMTRVLVMKPEPQWTFDSCDLNFIVLLTHARELKLLEEAKDVGAPVVAFVREHAPAPRIDGEMRIATRRIAKMKGKRYTERVEDIENEDDDEPNSHPPPKIEVELSPQSVSIQVSESPVLSKQLESLLDTSEEESSSGSDATSTSRAATPIANSRADSPPKTPPTAPLQSLPAISEIEAADDDGPLPVFTKRVRATRRESTPMVITASGIRRMRFCFRNSGVAATEMERRELNYMKKEGWLEQLIEGKTIPQSSCVKIKRRPRSPTALELSQTNTPEPSIPAPSIHEATATATVTSTAVTASSAKKGNRVRRKPGLSLCAVGTSIEPSRTPDPPHGGRPPRRAQSALGARSGSQWSRSPYP